LKATREYRPLIPSPVANPVFKNKVIQAQEQIEFQQAILYNLCLI